VIRRLPPIAAIGVLALVVIWGVLQIARPAFGPSIRAVSADRLRQGGIVLVNPFPWDQPGVSEAEAERDAVKQGPGGPVLQSVLAEVVLTNPSVTAPRLCWVVSLPGSLVSSNGPPGSPQRHASFYLVLIDAHSGEFVEGTAGG
jgi:hypothetical protein